MGFTTQITSTCLDTFAKYMSIHPLAFNSITVNNCIETTIACTAWMQYTWQNSSFISREMLSQYIRQSELEIAAYLGTFVKPSWVVSEAHEIPQPYHPNMFPPNIDSLIFKTDWESVNRFGQRRQTLLGTSTIVYSDNDLDGYDETALFDIIVTEIPTNLSDIYITYPEHNGSLQYKICPVEIVNIDTDTNTITFKGNSWNFVKESNITASFLNLKYLDGCTNIFQETVEIWYEDIDPCLPQIELVWTGDDVCARYNCTEYTQPACAVVLDKCNGYFSIIPQKLDEDNCVVTSTECLAIPSQPAFIRAYYQAGVQNNMQIEQAVIKLTASKLPQSLCTCGCILPEIQRLQIETSVSSQGGLRFSFPYEDSKNPFGTTIGAIEVYKSLSLLVDRLC